MGWGIGWTLGQGLVPNGLGGAWCASASWPLWYGPARGLQDRGFAGVGRWCRHRIAAARRKKRVARVKEA
jgi:hypothetical protein